MRAGRDCRAQRQPIPAVVLLDHRLPKMDGCDLLEIVVREPELQWHAYVFVTASSAAELRKDCDALPRKLCVAVIHKPFDIDDVLAAVSAAERRIASQGTA